MTRVEVDRVHAERPFADADVSGQCDAAAKARLAYVQNALHGAVPAPSAFVADQPNVPKWEARDDRVAVFTAAPDATARPIESRQLDELDAVHIARIELLGVLSRDVPIAAARAAAVSLINEENIRGRHPGVAAEGP